MKTTLTISKTTSRRTLGALAATLLAVGSFGVPSLALADEGYCLGSYSRCDETRAEEEARLRMEEAEARRVVAEAQAAEAEARLREAEAEARLREAEASLREADERDSEPAPAPEPEPETYEPVCSPGQPC